MQDNTQKNENENIKEPKTTKQKVLFILKIVGNVLFYLVIAFLLLFSIMNIRGGNGKENFPNIFGRGFLSVQSDSMKRTDELKDLEEWKDYKVGGFVKGDLLYVKTFKDDDCSNLKVGDVITFYSAKLQALNTHRIVYIAENKSYVITQGDNAAERQPFNKEDPLGTHNGALEASGATEHVSVELIKGVVTSVGYGKGKTLDNIQKYWIFIFILPVAIFLIFEILMVAKNIMALKNEKDKLKNPSPTKEELRAQILAELQAEQEKLRLQEAATVEPTEKAPETEPVAEEAVVEPVVVESVDAEEPEKQADPIVELPQDENSSTEGLSVEKPIENQEEPVMEQTPVEEEAPVVEAQPVVEETETPSEPIVEENSAEPTEEIKEPIEEVKPKPVRKKSTSSTTEKKSSGTKKASTGTKASSGTTKKTSTGTKKPASGTTKKASTGTKKSSSGTTKKSSSGAKTEKGE